MGEVWWRQHVGRKTEGSLVAKGKKVLGTSRLQRRGRLCGTEPVLGGVLGCYEAAKGNSHTQES